MVPEDQLEKLKILAADSAAGAIEPRIQAQNIIMVELIQSLVASGALPADSVPGLIAKVEAAAVAVGSQGPAGQALLDAALLLRHALSTTAMKH